MNIVLTSTSDSQVLRLFSEHDDFMLNFLGDDKVYYTRYSENENIESVWIAYEQDLPIGCIAYRKKSSDVGEIKRLFIREEYRGRGISKQLFSVLKSRAMAQNCRKLYLDTRITLEPAVSLYKNLGFEITFQQGLYVQMEMTI